MSCGAKPHLPPVPEGAVPRPSGPARPEHRSQPNHVGRKPSWLKVRVGSNPVFNEVRGLIRDAGLHTVCESASCPNISECWSNRAVTIMILGNVCTRSCGFCDVLTGKPGAADLDEPRRVAETLAKLPLRYTVITSVDRDDLDDGGASIWAETLHQIHALVPGLQVEVLTPDFKGDFKALERVLDAAPDIYAHNIETVQRTHRTVRPQAQYTRSLAVLDHAARYGATVKSGIMLGLGERFDEVVTTMRDLANAGVQLLTIGQYLRPSERHLPIERWVHPDEFAMLKETGESLGLEHVESGPLVRSSYKADQQAALMHEKSRKRS